jgi:hypothetical protein
MFCFGAKDCTDLVLHFVEIDQLAWTVRSACHPLMSSVVFATSRTSGVPSLLR